MWGRSRLCLLAPDQPRPASAPQENRAREQAQRQQRERERLKRRSVTTCSAWDVAPRDTGQDGPFPLTPQPSRRGLHSPCPSSEPCLAAPRGDNSPGPLGHGSPRLPPALPRPAQPPAAPPALLRRHTAPTLPALPEAGGCNQPCPAAPASRHGGLLEPELPEPPPLAAALTPDGPGPLFSLAGLFQRREAQRGPEHPRPPPAAPPPGGSALLGFLRRLAGGKGRGPPPS